MNVDFAFLCDYAQPEGKLTAVGIGIDTLYSPQVPCVHPQLFAVLAVRFTANETGRSRDFEMRLQDADGKDIVPALTHSVTIPPPPEGMHYRTHRVVLGMHGMKFDTYGNYQVSWLMDGTEVSAIPFRVAPPPAP